MSSSQVLRIGMLAGELSGDNLGVGLIREIRKTHPNAIIEGVGGPQMIAEGCRSMVDLDRLAMMGYIEPLLNLPRLLATRKKIFKYFAANPPDVFLGIDYAYFNNSLEQRLKAVGVKTAHYVSPQLWASRPGRIHKLKQTVDLMLCLFPFEVDIYRQHNIQATFVGHPLADQFPLEPDCIAARKSLELNGEKRLVAILPGSRSSEIKYLLKDFIEAARFCHQQDNNLEFIIPAANQNRFDQIQAQLSGEQLPIKLILGDSHKAMTAADVVLIASGTTTLEAMLLKKPMVVSYKVSALNYAIMSRILTSEHIALPNILAGERLVPEIVQNAVDGKLLGQAVMDYFNNPQKVESLKQRFTDIHQTLMQSGDARAAAAVLELAEQSTRK